MCDSTFFRLRLSTALYAHGINASPAGLYARTRTTEAFSCWCGCRSFRFGRSRCDNVCRHIHGWAMIKKNRNVDYPNPFFQFCRTESNPTSTRRQCVCPQQRSVRVPSTCRRWYCQTHPPTGEGTGILSGRCRTAVVMVAPATKSSLCWTHIRCRFFVSKVCRHPSWGTRNRNHTLKSSTCTKGFRTIPNEKKKLDS